MPEEIRGRFLQPLLLRVDVVLRENGRDDEQGDGEGCDGGDDEENQRLRFGTLEHGLPDFQC